MSFELSVIFSEIISTIWFVLPLYIANASLVVIWYFQTKGTWKLKKNKNFLADIDRIISKKYFGEHKTYLGIVIIISIMLLISFIQGRGIFLGLVLGIGMIFGILANSFIKRRIKLKSGGMLPVLDQTDFILGAQLAYFIVFGQLFPNFLFIFALTLIAHPLSCIAGYLLRLKEHWW